MAELPLDAIEQILVLLDAKDLIQCKCVCKSWKSVISNPRFVKAHLNHAYMNDRNNPELGHRRICISPIIAEDCWLNFDCIHIVGSCNGLLCVSPIGVDFVVTNPLTREHRKLPVPPYQPRIHKGNITREAVCWGFGYDSCTDDYKVIAGFKKTLHSDSVLFHVLTLKSNTWKVIGRVNYTYYAGITGTFCGGALHWFMTRKGVKNVIIALDLSTEELREIPLPGPDLLYECKWCTHVLGVIEGCLCMYSISSPLSTNKWVMKNNKWELYIDDHCQSKYDLAHHLQITSDLQMNSIDCIDDGNRVPINGQYIRASIFVKSLVSPHSHVNHENNNNHCAGQKGNAKAAGAAGRY